MVLFITFVITFCSVALKNHNAAPVYEKPEIIHHNQLTGGKTVGFSKSRAQLLAAKKAKKAASKQGERNNLIRGFTLEKLQAWVKKLMKENPKGMPGKAKIANLNDIKTFSIEIQKKIMEVIKTYDKKILKGKGETNIKHILISLNAKLKSFMHLPYFKEAYQNFMGSVIASSRNMSPKQLKDYHGTAKTLIKKYWKKYLEKAKADYKKTHKKSKKAKKAKKAKKDKKGKKGKKSKKGKKHHKK